MTVVQFKQQSFHALVNQTRACWDRADQKAADADQWMIRTGKLLVELKAKAKADGERWLDVLKKLGRSQQRANELMQLATSDVTIEQQRGRKRQSMKKSRAEKSPPRGGDLRTITGMRAKVEGGEKPENNLPPMARMRLEEEQEEDEFAGPGDGPQEFWGRSVMHLCGEVLARRALWTHLYPEWKKLKAPSHIKTLVKEAATEFAAITEYINKMKED